MRLLSRKLWVSILGLALIAVLDWFQKLDGVSATAITTIVGGYVGLNVLQKHVEAP